MQCKHFGACGSCILHDTSYQEQIEQKQTKVTKLLEPFYKQKLEVFYSKEYHYRARAEFRIWHEGKRCDYAMGNSTKDGAVIIEECPKVIEPIAALMTPLLEAINASDTLKTKLFAIEFLAATTGEVLVTMIYHKKLDEVWQDEAKALETQHNIHIIGRSRKQKVVLSQEFILETLPIDHQNYHYAQYEGGFTQPNPQMNIKMIEWAINQAQTIGYGDLLESYCGLGNFTIPLSRYFDKVLATEISKRSIASAQQNCSLNSASNIAFIRLSSEEMSQALSHKREFYRLRDIELDSYNFTCVLVDPPRAGLDEATINLIANIDHIIYISCNPLTLARDLERLSQTHEVQKAAIFDQFPYTHHIESGVFLMKKSHQH
ncbi:MAG: tRNA (uridine(54)-C5)-methyltransferase TrmA [Campylobacterales bacterium]|nr:tRNA (uridine(54)-C5)-methyltransferase TrmA [Campylobacterales bacterium]